LDSYLSQTRSVTYEIGTGSISSLTIFSFEKEENSERCEDIYTLKSCIQHIQSIPTHILKSVNHRDL
jgi:hypothetical protein